MGGLAAQPGDDFVNDLGLEYRHHRGDADGTKNLAAVVRHRYRYAAHPLEQSLVMVSKALLPTDTDNLYQHRSVEVSERAQPTRVRADELLDLVVGQAHQQRETARSDAQRAVDADL